MTRPPIDPELISEALAAARRALHRMDDKDIPAKLRDIAGRSGRLPAPFTRRLLAELDRSEWLRAEARAAIPEPEDSASESASFLFLVRPDGWEARIEALVTGHREAAERTEVHRLESELRRAIARSGRLEQKLAEAARREQEASGRTDERLAAAAGTHRRTQAKLKAVREALANQTAAAAQETSRLEAENAELRQKLKALTRSGRRQPVANPKPSRVEPAWSLDKPVALARHLDDITRALVVAPAKLGEPALAAGTDSLSGPPAGIAPDRAEAIVWLLGIPGMVHIAIDGWNAAHLIKSPPVPATRDRVIEAARRVILASAGKRRVTAVFDSSQLGESFSSGAVDVRFVASADEELIRMAQQDPTGLVVVTSDRRVREAVERAGAVGLWSEALIEWLKTGGRRTFQP